ncbi:glycosyltransferase WbuB [uncultured Flavobacterium sp.]|uniref:glycosyltransferase WbuB n=1 Tax=uncultured Flavobacterium sp. TaxID=165435 RepID=UPI0030CA3E61
MSRNKTITIFTGYYAPEDTAIGLYTSQFALFLSKKGYSVSVITGFPYYPNWEILNEYKNKSSYFNEIIDGIKIFRYKQYVPKNVTFIGRIKLMTTHLWGSYINSRKIKETDLVICIVPPTLSIIAAAILVRKTKAKLWVHVQDFEFDLAFQSGILNEKIVGVFFKKLVFSLEKTLLKKADIISAISLNMVKKTTEKTKKKEAYFFPNWVSLKNINPSIAKQHRYINKEKFTLLYSGNVGEKQNWALLELLAKKLMPFNVDIIIVGNGSYIEKLKHNLAPFDFVCFYEPIPYEGLNDLLCSADVHFLFQKSGVMDTVMPSKILGMMASGKPSIITGNEFSEVARIYNENNLEGFFCSDDIDPILNFIKKIKTNKENAIPNDLGSKEFVLEHFSEEKILQKFEEKIASIL